MTTIITLDGGQYEITDRISLSEKTKPGELYIRLKGTRQGLMGVALKTHARKDWQVKTSTVLKDSSIKNIFFNQVYSKFSLQRQKNTFLIENGIIFLNLGEKIKRPVIQINFTRDINTEIVTIRRHVTLKRHNAPKSLLYGCKKTKCKISWGSKSSTQMVMGRHHYLECHSFRCGNGEVVLVDSFIYYREKNKPDILVASIQFNEDLGLHLHPHGNASDPIFQKRFKTATRMVNNRQIDEFVHS